jgi:hypothetical protein
MNKIFGLLLIGAVVVCIAPLARSLDSRPMPPNVSAGDWVPLGDAAGFVITHAGYGSAEPAPGSVQGYFVLRHSGEWMRVDSESDLRTTPAGTGHGRQCPSENKVSYGQI